MDSERAKAACSEIISLANGEATANSTAQIEDRLGILEEYFSQTPVKKGAKVHSLSKQQKKQYLAESSMNAEFLTSYVKKKKKKGLIDERIAYTLYSSSQYGKIANRFFEKTTSSLTKQYPQAFTFLYTSMQASGLKILSETYISMMFFSAVLAFTVATPLAMLWSHASIIIQVMRGIFLGIVAAGATGLIFYLYPSSLAKSRAGAIKRDLPFVIVHMAAVAGSGGKPISIFTTVLSTDEYPGVRDEIKKIVNYVNLFGYDISTALKAVALRTPSLKLKDLLNGIVNTIESGGNLKDYLEAMADETLTTYRLERQKAIESISTYSDIYTTVLIAAPLLFFVTLAIIQTMGGEIGGVSVATLAFFGTYLVIPILNVAYMIFMGAVQPQ